MLVMLAVAIVFDSIWAASMVFLSLPLALGGVVAAFWATGTAFSREAAVGVILVIGLAVNQAILLVDGVLEREEGGRGGPAPSSSRLPRSGRDDHPGDADHLASPLPLAVGAGADDLFGSIALALVGGAVACTIGALLLLPSILVRRSRPSAAS